MAMFNFPIKTTATVTKGYNPTALSIMLGRTVVQNNIQMIEVTSTTTEKLVDGIRTERRTNFYPATMLQTMLSGYDVTSQNGKVNVDVLNQFLAQYSIAVVVPAVTPATTATTPVAPAAAATATPVTPAATTAPAATDATTPVTPAASTT